MASRLCAECGLPRVGTNWASPIVKRHPELQASSQQKHDYQRASCKDPKNINKWFEDIQYIILMYRIYIKVIYNSDETVFMIGQISAGMAVMSSLGNGKGKADTAWESEIGYSNRSCRFPGLKCPTIHDCCGETPSYFLV
jgi:hypothetical protein